MVLLQQIVVFAHLIGFAALLGGALAQLSSSQPEVNLPMLWGAWLQLVTGVGYLVLEIVAGPTVNYVAYGVALLVLAVAVLLVAKNRKFASIPRGLLLIIAALALVSPGIAVFWLPAG